MSVALETSEKPPPPGFKFRPTKKELISEFLKPKIEGFDSRVDGLVATVDLYKWEPGDLPGKSKVADEKKWYFLCRRERLGGREKRFKRKTGSGFWKSTCKVKQIVNKQSGEYIADLTTLVYYNGTFRTNWIIHEYSLPHQSDDSYVICRLKENRKKMQRAKNKADSSESLESKLNDHVAFGDTPSSSDVLPPENVLEENWNHESPSQSPGMALLDGSESSGNVAFDSEIQPVNGHVVVDHDSDVSPTQLSLLFASLEEQLLSGTSQQFHSLSGQPISPEIGIENLPGCPVESDVDAYVTLLISCLGEPQAAHELL